MDGIDDKTSSNILFLPRIEIHRLRSTINVSINIEGEEDRLNAIHLLQQLKPASQVTLALNADITAQEHIPTHDEWCRLLNCAIDDMKSGKWKKWLWQGKQNSPCLDPLRLLSF